MKKYKVTGSYTISFEMEVEANSVEEAEEMGLSFEPDTEYNGQSVFTTEDVKLCADGEVFDVDVECLDDNEEREE